MDRVNTQTQVAVRQPAWLSACARDESIPNYTAQRGEDRILRTVFDIIGEDSKWCVEFGAADGKRGSNTWQFIEHHGWSAVQIEPTHDSTLTLRQYRDSFEALEKRYASNEKVFCLNEAVEIAGDKSLDSLLARTPIPSRFDLLSIDIDSEDYRIWESLEKYQPRVVIIEHNKTIPIHIDFASDRGSSLLALTKLGKKKGYELVAATETNGIFVSKEYFAAFGISNNEPASIWPNYADYQSFLWQLYDGTIVFEGSNRLKWVRGADGTIIGQIQAGKVIQSPPKRFFKGAYSYIKPLVSGRIRALTYSLIDRL
ncbi:MAG: hypothetical protein WEC84_01340 [Candidatus Andersenbacteria bacterium]